MKIFIITIAISFSCLADAGNRKSVVTFVTGLWDVGRGNFESGYKRSYQYYLSFYKQLLQTNTNLIAFGDSQLKQFTADNRPQTNTLFIQKELSQIQKYWHTRKIWSVNDYLKSHPNQFDWERFKEFPSYGLKMYNAAVMSKLILIRQALEKDIFDTDYFVWIDGGLLHSFEKEALLQQAFEKIIEYYQIDWFLQASPKFGWMTLELGFRKESLKYRTQDPLEIPQANCWANWMGGKVQAAPTVLAVYQNLLRITLQNNEMYTDQSVFSLMLQRYSYLLTKLDILRAEQYIKFQAKRLDYNGQVQVQRDYHFVANRNRLQITYATPPSPFITIKTSSYDSIMSSNLFQIYYKTLRYRLGILLVTIGAYILIKLCYLNSNYNIFQYQMIGSRLTESQR